MINNSIKARIQKIDTFLNEYEYENERETFNLLSKDRFFFRQFQFVILIGNSIKMILNQRIKLAKVFQLEHSKER